MRGAMTPGSPKPEDADSAATGASEADAAKAVDFEPNRSAKPGAPTKPEGDEPPDAAELAGVKRRDGERDEDEAGPGAVSPEDLTTESDDGVS